MSEEPQMPEKKEKNWFARILKIIFILTACVLVGITILANMGGSHDSLKKSVEDFISNLFRGRPVEIEKLVHMSFFPKMGFDIQRAHIFADPEKEHTIATIGKTQIFMGFWNVALRRPWIAHFYLENFDAVKGAVGPKEFYIEKIFIDHDVEDKAAKLRGNGKVGVHPWSFTIDMAVHEGMDFFRTGRKYNYIFPRSIPFIFDIADIHFEGRFVNENADYYKFEDFKLSSGDQTIAGDITLSIVGEQILKMKGGIKLSEGQTIVSPDLLLDYARFPIKISGAVRSDALTLNDVIGDDAAFSIITRIRDVFGYGDIAADTQKSFLEKYNADLMFDIEKLTLGASVVEQIKFPVLTDNKNIKIGPVQSKTLRIPPLLLIEQDKTGEIITILQEGILDVSTAKQWLNLQGTLKTRDRLDIECGIAVFQKNDQDMITTKSFGIVTADGALGIRNKKETIKNVPDDLQFYHVMPEETADMRTVTLDKDAYDFVQSSLQSASETSPCVQYITQVQGE